MLPLLSQQEMFTRRGWVEAARLNTLDEASDHTAALFAGTKPFCSATIPRCSEIAGVQIVQRDSLRLDSGVTLSYVRLTSGALSIPMALNADLVVKQVEVHPIGRERCVEGVTDTSSVQDAREDSLPFRHRRFRVHVRRWVLSKLSNPCRGHFLSHLWPTCRRALFQFFRSARESWMSFFRESLRPVVMRAVKLCHSLCHPFPLRFAPLGVALPLQRDGFTPGEARDTKKVEEFRYGAARFDEQQFPDFDRRLQLLTIQPPQYHSRFFFRERGNPAQDTVKFCFHSKDIIHRQSNLATEAI